MFYLNNRIEKSSTERKHQSETVLTLASNQSAIAPLSDQLPNRSEGSLPIKLISNLNSNFLYFINRGFEHKTEFKYVHLKKQFLKFYHKIQTQQLINYLITAKSKDIQ